MTSQLPSQATAISINLFDSSFLPFVLLEAGNDIIFSLDDDDDDDARTWGMMMCSFCMECEVVAGCS